MHLSSVLKCLGDLKSLLFIVFPEIERWEYSWKLNVVIFVFLSALIWHTHNGIALSVWLNFLFLCLEYFGDFPHNFYLQKWVYFNFLNFWNLRSDLNLFIEILLFVPVRIPVPALLCWDIVCADRDEKGALQNDCKPSLFEPKWLVKIF